MTPPLTAPTDALGHHSDQALLAAHARGDAEAFAALVRRHAPLVLASCRRQLGAADADDACQAVFLLLARKPREAATAPVLAAWLLRSAWYVCARARRARARRTRAELEAAAVTTDRFRRAGDAGGARPEALAHLDELLASLPAHERDVLVLHVMEGVEHDELARWLGVASGTVRSRVSRGLSRLRERFARRGIAMTMAGLATLMATDAHAEVPPPLLAAAERMDGGAQADGAIESLARAGAHGLRVPAWTLALAGAATLALGAGAAMWWWSADDATREQPSEPSLAAVTAPLDAANAAATARMPATMAEAAALLPDDAHLSARAIDVDRNLARLRTTPYAALLQRPSGRHALERLLAESPQLSEWDPRRLRGAVGGLRFRKDVSGTLAELAKAEGASAEMLPHVVEYTGILLTRDGGLTGAEQALARQFQVGAAPGSDWQVDQAWGSLAMRRGDLVVADRPVEQVLASPRHAAPAAVAPDADLELASHRAFVDDLCANIAPGWYALTFDANGATSRVEVVDTAAQAATVRPTELAALRRLPADTLLALSRCCTQARLPISSQTSLGAILSLKLEDQSFRFAADAGAGLDDDAPRPAWLERLGLPEEIVLDGETLVYVRSGAPLPSATIALGMDEAQARTLLAGIAESLGTAPGHDGVVRGMIRIVPLEAAYIAGQLVVTTHPDGIAAHRAATDGGFGAHADVAAALAEVPETAYSVCVARTEAWAYAAQYLGVLAAALPADDAAALLALPADLRAVCAGRHEVMWSVAEDGVRRTVARGPVLGLLGPLLDPGSGELPLRSLWN